MIISKCSGGESCRKSMLLNSIPVRLHTCMTVRVFCAKLFLPKFLKKIPSNAMLLTFLILFPCKNLRISLKGLNLVFSISLQKRTFNLLYFSFS